MERGDNRDLLGQQHLECKEESIELRTVFATTQYTWSAVNEFITAKDSIVLVMPHKRAVVIPRRVLLSDQEAFDMQHYIREKYINLKPVA